MPQISIITPCHNTGKYLPAAIDSVMRQTFEDWELIIVDDGSSDNTREVAESYSPRLQAKLRYIYQSNRGLPAARNTGLRAARGEIISLLDADDIWLPSRLEQSLGCFSGNSRIGLVHARVARIDENGVIKDYPFVNPKYLSGRISHHIYTRRAHIMCPTVSFRKSCIDQVGFFDENMHATEDRDLWFRIAIKFEVAYIDEMLAYYRVSPNSMSGNMERMLAAQRVFIKKHYQAGVTTRLQQLEAIGKSYRECGDYLFNKNDHKRAILHYLRSVGYYPFSGVNTYMLVRALADPMVRRVRRKANRTSRQPAVSVRVR